MTQAQVSVRKNDANLGHSCQSCRQLRTDALRNFLHAHSSITLSDCFQRKDRLHAIKRIHHAGPLGAARQPAGAGYHDLRQRSLGLRRRRSQAHLRSLHRARRQLPRLRGRLRGRPQRRSARALRRRGQSARPAGDRHQVQLQHPGRQSQRRRQRAQEHLSRPRRLAAPPEDGLCRHVLDARVGHGHAGRRSRAHPQRPGAQWQDPLLRFLRRACLVRGARV